MKTQSGDKFIYSRIFQNIYGTSILNKIGILSMVILYIFLFSIGLAPLHKIKEFNKLVVRDSVCTQQYEEIYNNPEIIPLVREKIYKEALLILSVQDSIQLIVNLHDSLVCLSIKGVIIHKTRLNSIKIDPLLLKLPIREYACLFSKPINIKLQNATVVKEPIVIRQAPKDAEEAALNAYQPDTLVQNPAFLQLRLNYDINLIFEQDSNPTFNDKWVRFMFKFKMGVKDTIRRIGYFFSFKTKQIYAPSVVMKIPVDDLRTIYRALPARAYVVIQYASYEKKP